MGAEGADSWLNNWPNNDFALLPLMIRTIPWLAFEWVWMNALWHGEGGNALKFPPRPAFWRYLILFFVVGLAHEALSGLSALLMSWMPDARRAFEGAVVIKPLVAVALPVAAFGPLLLSILILVRLAVWNAAVIDRRRILGPATIWHLTAGYGAQIFLVLLVVTFVKSGLLIILVKLLPATEIENDGFISVASLILLPVELYAAAVAGAAALLIYRRIGGGTIPMPTGAD